MTRANNFQIANEMPELQQSDARVSLHWDIL